LSAPRRRRWPTDARVSSCAHSTSPRGTRTRRNDEARVDGPRRCDAMRPTSPTKPPWKWKNRMFLRSEALPTRFHGASEPPPRASETYLTASTLRYVSELQLPRRRRTPAPSELQLPRRICAQVPSELQLPKSHLCAPQRVPHATRDGRPQTTATRSLTGPLGRSERDARMSGPSPEVARCAVTTLLSVAAEKRLSVSVGVWDKAHARRLIHGPQRANTTPRTRCSQRAGGSARGSRLSAPVTAPCPAQRAQQHDEAASQARRVRSASVTPAEEHSTGGHARGDGVRSGAAGVVHAEGARRAC
jgi:hypothetical protein